jgi:hypothetical protein
MMRYRKAFVTSEPWNFRPDLNGTCLSPKPSSLRALNPAARSQIREELSPSLRQKNAPAFPERRTAAYMPSMALSEAKQSPEDSHVVWRLLRRCAPRKDSLSSSRAKRSNLTTPSQPYGDCFVAALLYALWVSQRRLLVLCKCHLGLTSKSAQPGLELLFAFNAIEARFDGVEEELHGLGGVSEIALYSSRWPRNRRNLRFAR